MSNFNYPMRFRSSYSGKVVEFESLRRGRQVSDDGLLSLCDSWSAHTDERWTLVAMMPSTTKCRVMAKLGGYRGKA